MLKKADNAGKIAYFMAADKVKWQAGQAGRRTENRHRGDQGTGQNLQSQGRLLARRRNRQRSRDRLRTGRRITGMTHKQQRTRRLAKRKIGRAASAPLGSEDGWAAVPAHAWPSFGFENVLSLSFVKPEVLNVIARGVSPGVDEQNIPSPEWAAQLCNRIALSRERRSAAVPAAFTAVQPVLKRVRTPHSRRWRGSGNPKR